MSLVFFLFQSPDNGRKLFKLIDPQLGEPLAERSYAADCRIFTPENNESQYYNLKVVAPNFLLSLHLDGHQGRVLCWTFAGLVCEDAHIPRRVHDLLSERAL